MLVKVYDVFPRLMYGQVRQPCLELQQNVLAGGLPGVLSLFASFARTRRSRRFGERKEATTGICLKIFLKRSVDYRMGCFWENIIHLALRKANFVSRNIGL